MQHLITIYTAEHILKHHLIRATRVIKLRYGNTLQRDTKATAKVKPYKTSPEG